MNGIPASHRPLPCGSAPRPQTWRDQPPAVRGAAAVGDVPALLDLAKTAADGPEARGGPDGVPVGDPGLRDRRRRRCRPGAGTASGRRRRSSPRPEAGGQAAGTSRISTAPDFDGAWGVFAAEAPGLRLEAESAGGWRPPRGPSPGAHSPPQLDHAVLTAHLDDGGRAAFAVDLHAPGVSFADPEWTSRGLREIPSGTVHFDAVPAVPLGGAGWYYQRPGFAWGGMGVAACWLGGAVAVARGFTGLPAEGGRRRAGAGPDRAGPPRRDRPDPHRPDRLPGPDRRTDRRRGTLGPRRVERGPAGPRAASPPPSNASRPW